MARQRVQGSAGGDEPEANDGADTTAPVDASAVKGTPTPLGGPKGVRILFNACTRDAQGGVTPPGERIVSAAEATELVKQGIAKIL